MQPIRKYAKRILLALVITIASIVLFLLVIGLFYGEQVKQLIVAEISKKLNVEVSVKQIDFSLFNNFPNASVDFTDLQTKNKSNTLTDPLLNAGKLSLLFDIIDIFWGDYTIEKIVLNNASLNLVEFQDGLNNFNVFQKKEGSKQEEVEIKLQKIILNNVLVSYLNQSADQEYMFKINNGMIKGNILTSNSFLDLEGDILSTRIRSGEKIFLQNQELKIAIKIKADQTKGIFALKESKITASGITLSVDGTFQSTVDNKNLNLKIRTDKSTIASLLSLIPAEFREKIKNYPMAGNFILNAKIEGDFSDEIMPHFYCDFGIDNGELRYTSSGLTLKNISFKGTFDNGISRKEESYSLKLTGFSGGINAGQILGELTITNFLKPLISASITSDLNLNKLNEILRIEMLSSISGNLRFNLQFTNQLKNLNKYTISDFLSSRTSGTMKISDVNIKFKNNPVAYNDLSGSFKFNNKDLLIERFTGKINTSDFDMKGYFLNILAYVFIPSESIKIKADFSSANLNMDDLLSIRKDRSGATYRMKFSDRVNFDLNLNLREFTFGTFNAENIKGNVVMKNKTLTVSETTLNAMEGKTILSGTIDGNHPEKFWINLSAQLTDVNIRQLFFQVGEFGQQNITSNHLKGRIDATIYYKSFIDPELKIDAKSVYALGDIIIREGELINYSPLFKLSKYIKQKELEQIHFSTLKNQIEIKDEVVYIPEMDIESSSLNLKIFGNHTFKNTIDYHVRILLSDLLSKKDKEKEEEIEGIFTKEDGLGKTTLFLHMTGNAENPDIRYDAKEVRKKISADMTIEKKEIKDAFKREFGSKDQSWPSEKDELENNKPESGTNFKIEWEEDQPKDTKNNELQFKPKNEPEKKTNKKDFIIEWDEDKDTLNKSRLPE